MPQVLQRTQELRVLAHEEAVVSPTLQNSAERQGRASAAWGRDCRATGLHLPGAGTAGPAGPQGFTRGRGRGAAASHQPQPCSEPSLAVPGAGRVRVLVAKGGMWGLISGGGKGLHVHWGTTGL